MARVKLSMAIEHYDRTLPFIEGRIQPEEIELTVLTVSQQPARRHERMIQHQEFDICELSLSSYLMAKSRGAPLLGIPIFPRRLFSQSNMYCNVDAGIESPTDLTGKRAGLISYQTTLSVLAKGDLQYEYGVPLGKVAWFTAAPEAVAFEPPPGVRIEQVADELALAAMLEAGEIDALMMPRTPRPILVGSARVRRLFPNPKEEELRYFKKLGYYPIMHLIALQQEVLQRHSWVAKTLFDACLAADEMCRTYYSDPNWSRLAWVRHLVEEEERAFGGNPWFSGLAANRANLERFIMYSHTQGLIEQPMAVESLFAESVLGT